MTNSSAIVRLTIRGFTEEELSGEQGASRGRYREDHCPSQRDGEQQEGRDPKTEDSKPPPPHCHTTVRKP